MIGEITVCDPGPDSLTNDEGGLVTLPGDKSCFSGFDVEETAGMESMVCCKDTHMVNTCPSLEPPYSPYITTTEMANFIDPTSPNWGRLKFEISLAKLPPKQLIYLNSFDTVFIRELSVFLPGAKINRNITSNLNVRISPTGQMTNYVSKNAPWADPACAHSTTPQDRLCSKTDHVFSGAPSSNSDGRAMAASYTSHYFNPDGHDTSGKPICVTGSVQTPAIPVFTINQFTWCGDAPCGDHYCTDLSFKGAEVEAILSTPTSKINTLPYNLASLYSTFELSVYNDDAIGGLHTVDSGADNIPSSARSQGIDLSGVTSVEIGVWLLTPEGKSSDGRDTCDAIATNSLAFTASAPTS